MHTPGPLPLTERFSKQFSVDAQHKEQVFFRLGAILEEHSRGFTGRAEQAENNDLLQMEHNPGQGYFAFEVSGGEQIGLSRGRGRDWKWDYGVVLITADDYPAIVVRFRLDMTLDDPVRITSVD